jgi:hypothetical protein
MKKLMDEYELQDKQPFTYEDIIVLKEEIRQLKEKLASVLPEQCENGDYPKDDGSDWNPPSPVTKQVLENAYTVCKDCGKKYGEYSVGCSSVWEGECDVCGETKPVTEKRDYGYLEKGIAKLSK